MKRLRLRDLQDVTDGHFLKGIIPGEFLCQGALSFKHPGQRTHGTDPHVHEDHEVFVLLQGKAVMEIDGEPHHMQTGDIIVCEPGEDHHLISDEHTPCINLWLHAGPTPHPDQQPASK